MGRKRRTYMIRSIILYFLTDIFYILWKNLGFVQLNNQGRPWRENHPNQGLGHPN